MRAAIDEAREQVAMLVHAHPSQVVFTSGGTEANNLALKGMMFVNQPGRLAVSAIEHASLLEPAYAMTRHGWHLDLIAVDEQGRVTAEAIRAVLKDHTRLVSVMAANNETGVIQDIVALAAVVRESRAMLHVDAAQAVGKMAVDFASAGAQLMTLSAHKIYGPKGVGALIRDRSLELEPLLHGGSHEYGLRGGTEHVAGIVGFGKAAELAHQELAVRSRHVLALRRRLEACIRTVLPEIMIVAEQVERLSNTVMLAVPGMEGETLLMNLDQAGIAVSSGSACHSGSGEPSHVLTAMGYEPAIAKGALRVSFGLGNSREDVQAVAKALQEIVASRGQKVAAVGW